MNESLEAMIENCISALDRYDAACRVSREARENAWAYGRFQEERDAHFAANDARDAVVAAVRDLARVRDEERVR